ncbi:GNA1162 family protein [Brumicola nitratireducens]|nr:GNA1162 family protein [Glaciecola nitratireducens]
MTKMIKTIKLVSMLSVVALGLSGCAGSFVTKEEAFPKMYQARPVSILVIPAVNNTTAAEATEYYATTVAEPLTRMGYYVLPIEVTNRLIQEQGIVDGAQLASVDAGLFKTMYGADAIMYVTINQWDTSYFVVGGSVTVGIAYELVSTTSKEVLWQYADTVVVDTGGGNSGGGLIGAIISTAINTAMTDYVPLAKQVNYTALSTMPYGGYHAQSGMDQKAQAVNKNKAGVVAVSN